MSAAISAAPGQFLLKDLFLLAASLSLILASVQGPWLNVQKSRVNKWLGHLGRPYRR